jgi:hypothetical protein
MLARTTNAHGARAWLASRRTAKEWRAQHTLIVQHAHGNDGDQHGQRAGRGDGLDDIVDGRGQVHCQRFGARNDGGKRRRRGVGGHGGGGATTKKMKKMRPFVVGAR